jgi:hypothetical protein
MLKLKLNRRYLSIFLILFCLSAVSLPVAHTQRVANYVADENVTPQGSQTVLNVALYPYVPRLDQFKTIITAAWARFRL